MSQSTALSVEIPADVRDFCARNELLGDLNLALQIAEDCFAPVEKWNLSLQEDPEIEGETSVIIDLWIACEITEAMRKDAIFTHRWARSASPEGICKIALLWYLR